MFAVDKEKFPPHMAQIHYTLFNLEDLKCHTKYHGCALLVKTSYQICKKSEVQTHVIVLKG